MLGVWMESDEGGCGQLSMKDDNVYGNNDDYDGDEYCHTILN